MEVKPVEVVGATFMEIELTILIKPDMVDFFHPHEMNFLSGHLIVLMSKRH